jgi:hypothetical protein
MKMDLRADLKRPHEELETMPASLPKALTQQKPAGNPDHSKRALNADSQFHFDP